MINSSPRSSVLSPRQVDSNAMWTTLLRVYRWISCHVASHKLPCPNKVHGTEDLQESETQNASMVPAKVKARPSSQGDLALRASRVGPIFYRPGRGSPVQAYAVIRRHVREKGRASFRMFTRVRRKPLATERPLNDLNCRSRQPPIMRMISLYTTASHFPNSGPLGELVLHVHAHKLPISSRDKPRPKSDESGRELLPQWCPHLHTGITAYVPGGVSSLFRPLRIVALPTSVPALSLPCA